MSEKTSVERIERAYRLGYRDGSQAARIARLPRPIRWLRYVLTPTIYPERWQDRLFRGHTRVVVGPVEVVVFGANAMHWALHVWALGHWWCFHPTTRTFGGYWPWYFYVSKNSTPWAACFEIGGSHKRQQEARDDG